MNMQPCHVELLKFNSLPVTFSDEVRHLFRSVQDRLPDTTLSLLSRRNSPFLHSSLSWKTLHFAVIAFRFTIYRKEENLLFFLWSVPKWYAHRYRIF